MIMLLGKQVWYKEELYFYIYCAVADGHLLTDWRA